MPDKCQLCKSDGPSEIRIRNLCETCYTAQYIAPLQKEVRNQEEAISILHNNLMERLMELGQAKKYKSNFKEKIYKCNRDCGFITNSAIALVWHEPECEYRGEAKKPRRNSNGNGRVKSVQRNEEEEIFG
jgi:hypothetical protein